MSNRKTINLIKPVEEERKSIEFLKKKKGLELIDWRTERIKVIKKSKQWHKLHQAEILKRYEGKYIAIILNPQKGSDTPLKEAIVGVTKNFHQLATKVYKKYGYTTIYMPFISREPITREIHIPTPIWIKRG